MAVSGTPSSVSVEMGTSRAPKVLQLTVVALVLKCSSGWDWPPRVGEREVESGGWSFSSNSISDFQGPEVSATFSGDMPASSKSQCRSGVTPGAPLLP